MKKGGIPNEPLYPKPVAVHSRMADSKTLQEHQEALLNLRSRSLRLAYALENFTDIRKAIQRRDNPDKRGGGRTWPALKFLKKDEIESLAIDLASEDWAGKKCAAQMMLMADKAFGLMRNVDADFIDRWGLGRILMSAFTYAGIYHLGKIEDYSRAPYYVLDRFGATPDKQPPTRTKFEPFPKWTRNIDEFGNRLVRHSYPCPPKFYYKPVISENKAWVRAVHKLENTPFQINKDVLEWASDPKVNEKLVPPKLENQEKRFDAFKSRKPRIRKLKRLYDKEAKDHLHKFKKADQKFWRDYWEEYQPLSAEYNRVDSRRKQFERELEEAKDLAKKGKPFYHRVSVDYRGRLYLPTFSYQGSDFCRAVIEFADSGLMTADAVHELARHTVNVEGTNLSHLDKYDAMAEGNLFTHIALEPMQKANLKRIAEAEKSFCFYRSCLEWRDTMAHRIVGLKSSKDSDDKKMFSKISKRNVNWAESHYKTLDLVTVKKKTHKGSGFYTAKDNKMLRSHLPIAADHRSSAFVHIGFMLNTPEGQEMVSSAMEEDLYQVIADRCTDLPKKYSRKIVKMVMVPWSYGGTEWSCKDKVSQWRMQNPKKIKYLDRMSWNELSDMVDSIFEVLNDEFEASGQFRSAMSRAINLARKRTDRNPTDGIRWTTESDFVVHQAAFKTSKKPDLVANGFGGDDVQIIARMPTDTVDWRKMETKTPPNLVHSQDATVVHMMFDGKVSWVSDTTGKTETFSYFPMVSVHDSFSVLPDDARHCLRGLEIVTTTSYVDDPLVQFGRSVVGRKFNIRKDRSFRVGDNPYS